MLTVSNYYQQSHDLPAENGYQIMLLKWTDASTYLREASKCGTVVGLVASASSLVFKFDPTVALVCTAVSGVNWLLSRSCAKKLEPQAEEMIEHFKDLRARRNLLSQNEARTFRLIN